jgi:hypothetical protein
VEINQINAAPHTRNPNCWPDRLKFEWPWLRAVLLILAIFIIVMPIWPSRTVWGLISACCACFCCLAIGLSIERKSFGKALVILGIAWVAGVLLPVVAVQAIWSFIAILLGFLVVGLRYFFPYRPRLVRVGDKYTIGDTAYEMSHIKMKTPRVFYLRPELLEQMMGLAAYADGFLDRHGIRYVLCYGSLLGALRHNGPMPWDDDVDFTIYRPQDIQKLEESFAVLAAAASQDGYCLFAHNDYWKLSRKGFWRYPVVDLYRAAIYQPIDTIPGRAAWGSLTLSVPDNAANHVTAYYGQESLTVAVFDLPYWDSGFVPAAATRLFGIGFSNLAGVVYQRLYGNS